MGLFAVARSPSGSITTKMVRFRHEVRYPVFLHNENPSKRLRTIWHPTTLSDAFPLCESSAKPVGGILFASGAFRFYYHRKPVKKDSDDSYRRPHGSLHNEITLFVTQSLSGFHYRLNPSKRLQTFGILPRCPMRFHSANHQPNPLAAFFSQAERSGFSHQKSVEKGFGQSLLPTVRYA